MSSPDYAEVLRLYRKYHARPGEPLWEVFVHVGKKLETIKPERCKTCHYTALGYSRLVDKTCVDPWHATADCHLFCGGCRDV